MTRRRGAILLVVTIAIGVALWKPVVALAVILAPGLAIAFAFSHLAPHAGVGLDTAASLPLDLPGGRHLVGVGWVPLISLLFWTGVVVAWVRRR